MSNIKIKIKHHEMHAYGDPYDYDHIIQAANILRIGAVEPTRRVRFKRACKRLRKNIRKFFKCLKYALKNDDDIGYIEVRKIR